MQVETYKGEKEDIKSLTDALGALKDLGASLDGAFVLDDAHDYTIVLYDANLGGFGVRLKSPDTEAGLEQFLFQLFEPFLFKQDSDLILPIVSHAKVEKHTPSPYNIFKTSMVLYLRKEFSPELHDTLKKQADNIDKVEITHYTFD
jgi:hypothetical protein